jgi:competence/damage-inducible protein CinA-like protein
MIAAIAAVGSELLTPFRTDTNSLAITAALNEVGYDVRRKVVVGDRVDELAAVVAEALTWADLVVTTGGLGPTEDDVTRQAVARVLDLPLEEDAEIVARLRDRFARRGIAMAEINRRQALVPRGAEVVENPNGSAPGLWLERGRTALLLLPGPPREMKPMLERVIAERLSGRARGAGLYRRVLKITGRTESDVDATVQPIYGPWQRAPIPITTTILAVLGQIELHLSVHAATRAGADGVLDPAVAELVRALGPAVYSVDGRTLEAVVGARLAGRGWRIAAAESCTGGLLTSRLTDVPGSSAYVDRSVICYSNAAKVEWLGVPPALIEAHGAVSEPVARAMAEGIRARAGVEVGLGVTGIAGPGGGSESKPVGTVVLAVATPDETRVRTVRLFGGREQVKYQAAQAAMNLLRLMIDAALPRG